MGNRVVRKSWGALLTTAALVALVHCASFGSDSDAPVIVVAGDAAPADEGGSSVDTGTPPPPPPADAAPACDLTKNFANAVPFTHNGQTLNVSRFRLSRDGRTAYASFKDVDAGVQLNTVQSAPITGGTVVGAFTEVFPLLNKVLGFSVSNDELAMVLGFVTKIHATGRNTKSEKFTDKGELTLPVANVPNAATDDLADPYVTGTGDLATEQLFFARFVVDAAQQQYWTLFNVAGTAGTPIAVDIGLSLGVLYAARPVARDPKLLRYMGWGGVADPRIYEQRFVSGAWSTPPKEVLIEGLPIPSPGAVVPFDVSADDCELVFGVGTQVDGPYDVYRARRPN